MPKSQKKKWRENFDKHERNRENPEGNLIQPLSTKFHNLRMVTFCVLILFTRILISEAITIAPGVLNICDVNYRQMLKST